MAVVGLLHETEHKELYPSPIITATCSSRGVTVDYVLLEEYLAATRSGSSETTTIGHQNRDGWDAVRRTPGPGRTGTPAMQSHVESEGHGGYGMEGGVPGMLGTPLSRPETLWVSIDEPSMKPGDQRDDPNDFHYFTLTATFKSDLLSKGIETSIPISCT